MNRDLARQHAFSKRAPGQAYGEEMIRRLQTNQISAAQKMAGGDVNKQAALVGGATKQAEDAGNRLAVTGEQFSEAAFGRLSNAQMAIAAQKKQNRDEFNRTKSDLYAASDQNFFNAISNVATAGVTDLLSRGPVDQGLKAQGKASIAMGRRLNSQTPNAGGTPYIKEGRQMLRNARRTNSGLQMGPWMNWNWGNFIQNGSGGNASYLNYPGYGPSYNN